MYVRVEDTIKSILNWEIVRRKQKGRPRPKWHKEVEKLKEAGLKRHG